MIVKSSFTFILIASLVAPGASAQGVEPQFSVQIMREYCLGENQNASQILQEALCIAQLEGVSRVMGINCESAKNGAQPLVLVSASPPGNIAPIRHAFLRYVDENPSTWELDWSLAVYASISNAFPCDNF